MGQLEKFGGKGHQSSAKLGGATQTNWLRTYRKNWLESDQLVRKTGKTARSDNAQILVGMVRSVLLMTLGSMRA